MHTNCEIQVHQLLNKPLSHHAWNSDKSKLAVCPNSEEIVVLKRDGKKWIVEDILSEHDQLITGLDWCKVTNKIVSCSMDRNAYVWVTDGKGKWKPTLAALRISKGATCVAWNSSGTKFAAGSSNGSLVVGHFEEENDWWLCKHLKVDFENTITSLAWHPNGVDLVAGSIDGKILITSGFIKSIDKNASSEPSCNFNEKCSSAVLNVTFSPSGTKLAYLSNTTNIKNQCNIVFCVGHDANLTLVNLENNEKEVISLGELPMLQLKFISDNLIISTGHNYSPIVIGTDKSTKKWKIVDEMTADDGNKKSSSSSAFGSAFAKFKSMDDCGTAENKSSSSQKSGHKNTISHLDLLTNENGQVNEISTSSFDGNLIIWDMKNVLNTQGVSNLKI